MTADGGWPLVGYCSRARWPTIWRHNPGRPFSTSGAGVASRRSSSPTATVRLWSRWTSGSAPRSDGNPPPTQACCTLSLRSMETSAAAYQWSIDPSTRSSVCRPFTASARHRPSCGIWRISSSLVGRSASRRDASRPSSRRDDERSLRCQRLPRSRGRRRALGRRRPLPRRPRRLERRLSRAVRMAHTSHPARSIAPSIVNPHAVGGDSPR